MRDGYLIATHLDPDEAAFVDLQGFAAWSMGPKVEAVTRFAEAGHGVGIITSLPRISEAIEGRAGTRVTPA